jgi:hemoglobin
MSKLYEELGGLEKLKEIVESFTERMFKDIMIGFFFHKVDKARVKEKEFEFLASFLGAEIPYTGNGIAMVHANHRILTGHFERRKQILKETLIDFKVPENVISEIMTHTDNFKTRVIKTGIPSC